MSPVYFDTELFLPVDIQLAWEFFSSARNLTLITPPELGFRIVRLPGPEIFEGMVIDYTVTPFFGIPLRWKTEIASVLEPYQFVDRQLNGPYKIWEHTHTFIEKKGGVLVHDRVRYQLPFGVLGHLVDSVVVRRKIENIFSYRKRVLQKIFNGNGSLHN